MQETVAAKHLNDPHQAAPGIVDRSARIGLILPMRKGGTRERSPQEHTMATIGPLDAGPGA